MTDTSDPLEQQALRAWRGDLELGRRSVALLLDQMTGREPSARAVVPPVLTIRESTAPWRPQEA